MSRRFAVFAVALWALVLLTGARYTATIRRVEAGTFYVVIEDAAARDAKITVIGISNISAALDTAKVRLGQMPGVPADIKIVRITVDTQPAP